LAGLLGMIRDHVEGQHAIDFANPKRPPPPPNYRRKIAIYGAAAAVVFGAVVYHFASQISEANAAVRDSIKKLREVERVLERTNEKKMVVDEIAAWQARDVNWLDELRDLSARFPVGRDAVVQRLTASPTEKGGIIDLQVQVRDPAVMQQMENQLRDAYHQVRAKGATQRSEQDTYQWQTDVTVYVTQRTKQQYVQQFLPKEESAAPEEPAAPATQLSRAEPTAERK
jgi:hypothetical protein